MKQYRNWIVLRYLDISANVEPEHDMNDTK